MTQQENSDPLDAGIASETSLNSNQVRLLQIAVVAMGLMILAGLAAVIGRVIYLASVPQKQAGSMSNLSNPSAGANGSIAGGRSAGLGRLALPAQSVVRHLSLSGDRLAVHFDGPSGAGIAIVDAHSGSVLSRIELVPEVPR